MRDCTGTARGIFSGSLTVSMRQAVSDAASSLDTKLSVLLSDLIKKSCNLESVHDAKTSMEARAAMGRDGFTTRRQPKTPTDPLLWEESVHNAKTSMETRVAMGRDGFTARRQLVIRR